MPLPLLALASLFLAGGSTIANTIAARQQTKARNDVLAAERIRQRQYDAEAQGLNTQSQDRYQDFSGDQAVKAQTLGDYFKGETTAGDPNVTAAALLPSSSSDVVTREIASKQGAADAFGGQQAQALGTLRSFGDLLGDTSRLQARDASQIGQIGGFKRGSSAVVPYELEAAAQKGGMARLFADILSGASAVTAGARGGGGVASLFGGAAPAVSPALGAAAAAGRAPGFLAAQGRAASLYPVANFFR